MRVENLRCKSVGPRCVIPKNFDFFSHIGFLGALGQELRSAIFNLGRRRSKIARNLQPDPAGSHERRQPASVLNQPVPLDECIGEFFPGSFSFYRCGRKYAFDNSLIGFVLGHHFPVERVSFGQLRFKLLSCCDGLLKLFSKFIESSGRFLRLGPQVLLVFGRQVFEAG
jgi:hypothetical protein